MNMILASASPRRRELLKQIGFDFTVLAAQGEEVSSRQKPQDIVVELAEKKAGEIYEKVVGTGYAISDTLIIGADTIVVCEGQILGKPKDKLDAVRMLSMLSGITHEVYTGVSLWIWQNERKEQYDFYEKTDVTMYPIGEQEIKFYIDGGEPMDKAGAYGIQGSGARFIQKIDGDYNNVVGLPIARLYQEIIQLGIDISCNSL